MRRKYRIKKMAKNEFARLSGLDCTSVDNGNNCIVIDLASSNGVEIHKYAYSLYNNINYKLSNNVHVSSTCGIKNCIASHHLTAVYLPSKKDSQYINDYLRIDGIEQLSIVFKVPISLLTEYLTRTQL